MTIQSRYNQLLTSLLILFILVGCNDKKVETKSAKPNVIFIMMDDLGYGQFGVFNDTLTTKGFDPFFVHLVDSLQGYSLEKSLEFSKSAVPTMTRLAKNGVLFNKAFTSSSLCAPSRVGIATGTSQNRFGFYTNMDTEKAGIVPGTHLVEKLKELNYKTAHIGKWHMGVRDSLIISNTLKKHGINENYGLSKIGRSHPEIAKEIEEKGYIGSVVKRNHPLNNGFDYYYGYNHWASQYYNDTNVWENYEHAGQQVGYNTDVFTDKALQFMDKELSNKESFYLQLHLHAVHDSVEPIAPSKYLKKFKSDYLQLGNFYAHIYGVDQNINRIVEFLKSKNEFENTIIIFTSDNGAMAGGSYNGHKSGSPLPGNAPFSGHKGNYYQGGMRVPLFFHWPAGIENKGISDKLVSTMDILPSVIDAAGGELPNNIDGKSLLPILRGEQQQNIHDHLIWAGIQASKWGFHIAKSTKTHADESDFAPPAWTVIQDDYLLRFTGILEPGIYKDYMNGREPFIELFHIKNDPSERINLAGKMPEKVTEMAQLYFDGSADYPAPVFWKKEKWEELVNSEKLFTE